MVLIVTYYSIAYDATRTCSANCMGAIYYDVPTESFSEIASAVAAVSKSTGFLLINETH